MEEDERAKREMQELLERKNEEIEKLKQTRPDEGERINISKNYFESLVY